MQRPTSPGGSRTSRSWDIRAWLIGEKTTWPRDPAAVPSPRARDRRSGPMTRAMAASTREREQKATPRPTRIPPVRYRAGALPDIAIPATPMEYTVCPHGDYPGRAVAVRDRSGHRHSDAPQQVLDRQCQREGLPRPAVRGRHRLQEQTEAGPYPEPDERDQACRRDHCHYGNAALRKSLVEVWPKVVGPIARRCGPGGTFRPGRFRRRRSAPCRPWSRVAVCPARATEVRPAGDQVLGRGVEDLSGSEVAVDSRSPYHEQLAVLEESGGMEHAPFRHRRSLSPTCPTWGQISPCPARLPLRCLRIRPPGPRCHPPGVSGCGTSLPWRTPDCRPLHSQPGRISRARWSSGSVRWRPRRPRCYRTGPRWQSQRRPWSFHPSPAPARPGGRRPRVQCGRLPCRGRSTTLRMRGRRSPPSGGSPTANRVTAICRPPKTSTLPSARSKASMAAPRHCHAGDGRPLRPSGDRISPRTIGPCGPRPGRPSPEPCHPAAGRWLCSLLGMLMEPVGLHLAVFGIVELG